MAQLASLVSRASLGKCFQGSGAALVAWEAQAMPVAAHRLRFHNLLSLGGTIWTWLLHKTRLLRTAIRLLDLRHEGEGDASFKRVMVKMAMTVAMGDILQVAVARSGRNTNIPQVLHIDSKSNPFHPFLCFLTKLICCTARKTNDRNLSPNIRRLQAQV